jgi:Right handed beta helix region
LASSNASVAGGCAFDITPNTWTLLADCTTDETILVPEGFTLDGDGHSITAVDPVGNHFRGAVLKNAGTVANVTNVEITASGLADVCDGGPDRLRGILLDGASGSITSVTVHGVRQGLSGCQEGNAIEVRNVLGSGPAPGDRLGVSVSDNTVSDYQKNGITVNGNVSATIERNTVTGDGPIGYIAQNGIQVGFGASALVEANTVSGNSYTGPDVACGLLIFEAQGVRQSKNTFFGNERDVCNFGRGGGKVMPATS